MQQIVFKRKFSVLLDTVKTENVQHLEEKIQPIKNIIIRKIQKKIKINSLKINELSQSSQAGVYFFQLNSC